MSLFDIESFDEGQKPRKLEVVRTASEAQSRASAQGRQYEDHVCLELHLAGWTVDQRKFKIPEKAGLEIDIVATDPRGRTWWIECKGSWEAKVNGCERGDTIKKAIGPAMSISTMSEHPPYMLVTSHLPKPDSVGAVMLQDALDLGLFEKAITHHDIRQLCD